MQNLVTLHCLGMIWDMSSVKEEFSEFREEILITNPYNKEKIFTSIMSH